MPIEIGVIKITIENDVRDPTAALEEVSRIISEGDLAFAGVPYALVAGQRFYADGHESAEAFERRVRTIVTEWRAGFMIMIEGAA